MNKKSYGQAALAIMAAGLLSPVFSQAEQFTLWIYENAEEISARIDPSKAAGYWAGYNAVAKEMVDSGIMRGGSALKPLSQARHVGPLPASPQSAGLAGFFTIEVPDMATAIQWASKIPASKTGRILIMPHMTNPTMTQSDKR